MKHLILTITIVLVLIGISADVANAQINWQYIAQSEMIRHTSCGRLPRMGVGVGVGGYGTNVRVRSNESWNLQGGQRSYEQYPDYLGKVIDSATTLGALAILSH